MADAVKDLAARRAEDAARHGYNGRTGPAAQLLKECARAVRIAAASVASQYNVPEVSADERAEYASELAARMLGENDGRVPTVGREDRGYLVTRARGLIMNDKARRGLDMSGGAGEVGADSRLDGPLSIPVEIDAACRRLNLSRAAHRAFVAAVVPATRGEWADFYGYSGPESFKTIAKRGRAELRMIGQDAIRQALRDAEAEACDILDEIEHDLRNFSERMTQI